MKKILLVFSFCLFNTAIIAQNIGINNPSPAPSALLDLTSSNKGLLIPRVALLSTNNNAPIGASIATSLLVYNTATAGVSPNNVTPGYYYWDGTKWIRFETSMSDYYSRIGTTIIAAPGTLSLMQGMDLNFIPNDTIGIVSFSAAGSNSNSCGQREINFSLIVNGTPILPFHTTIEDVVIGTSKIWDVSLNYTINLNPNTTNSVQIFWKANCGSINNGPGSQLGSNGSYRHLSVMIPQGSGVLSATIPPNPNDWSINGNIGTNPNSNFIGTADATDLVMRTGNVSRMTITAAGKVGINTLLPPVQMLQVEGPSSQPQISGSGSDGILRLKTNPNITGFPVVDLGLTNTIGNSIGWIQVRNATNYSINNHLSLQPNGGNVGIGINNTSTNPGQRLEVQGLNSAASPSGSAQDGIARFSPTGSSAVLDIGYLSSPAHAWLQSRDRANFGINYSLCLNPNGGNVGVGTTTPGLTFVNTKLDVIGLPTGQAPTIRAGGGGDVVLAQGGSLFFDDNYSYLSGNYIRPSSGPNSMGFFTSGSERIKISSVGDVGIGIGTPIRKLHVLEGTTSGAVPAANTIAILESNIPAYLHFLTPTPTESGLLFGTPSGSIRSGVIFNSGVTDGLDFRTGGNTVRMVINSGGNVGIGTFVPTQRLHVVGNGLFSGSVTASCGVLSCSDLRYKKDIQPLTDVLNKITSLNGVLYRWKKDEYPEKEFPDTRQLGVIAQELEAIFPELVHTDSEGFKTVDYSRLTPVLLEAIKELKRENDLLKAASEEVNAKMKYLDRKLEYLIDLNVKAAAR